MRDPSSCRKPRQYSDPERQPKSPKSCQNRAGSGRAQRHPEHSPGRVRVFENFKRRRCDVARVRSLERLIRIIGHGWIVGAESPIDRLGTSAYQALFQLTILNLFAACTLCMLFGLTHASKWPGVKL